MIKVTWSAGHGLHTSGKRTPDGQAEWTFNDKVVRAGMNFLAQYNGVAQLRLDDPTGAIDIPLKERSNRANSWGSNLHVDAHHNALNETWKNESLGIETFTMLDIDIKKYEYYTESLKVAKLVHPKVLKAMNLKDRGIKSSNLHMLRELKCPAILTEGGFMDSKVDVAIMRQDAKLKAQGEAIAQGIVQYLGLKKKEETKMPVVETAYAKHQKPSPSLAKEYEEAVKLGITDGTYPMRPATREEVAVMIYRATKKEGNK